MPPPPQGVGAAAGALPSCGVLLDRAPMSISGPSNEVMAHAVFETAQVKLEATQEVAQAKLDLAIAKLAVVESHVVALDPGAPPPQSRATASSTWMRRSGGGSGSAMSLV